MRIVVYTDRRALVLALTMLVDHWDLQAVDDRVTMLREAPDAEALIVEATTTSEGLDLVESLAAEGVELPTVIVGDRAVEAGAIRIVTRPFTVAELRDEVEWLLHPELRREPAPGERPEAREAPPREIPEPGEEPADQRRRGGLLSGLWPFGRSGDRSETGTSPGEPTRAGPAQPDEPPEPAGAEDLEEEPAPSASGPEPEPEPGPEPAPEPEPAPGPVEAEPQGETTPAEPEHVEAEQEPAAEVPPEPEPRLEEVKAESEPEPEPEPESREPAPAEPTPSERPAPPPAARQPDPTRIRSMPLPTAPAAGSARRSGMTERAPADTERSPAARWLGALTPRLRNPTLPTSDLRKRVEIAAEVAADLEVLLDDVPALARPEYLCDALIAELLNAFEPETAAIWERDDGGTWHVLRSFGLTRAETTMRVAGDHPLFRPIAENYHGVLLQPTDLARGFVGGVAGTRTEAVMAAPIATPQRCHAIVVVGTEHLTEADLERLLSLTEEAAPGLALATTLRGLVPDPALAGDGQTE